MKLLVLYQGTPSGAFRRALEFIHFRAPKGRPIPAQANEGVKKSRLCRLLCGRAQPFRTAGLRLNSLGSATCRKAVGFPWSFYISDGCRFGVGT